jgi:hypothetical protein
MERASALVRFAGPMRCERVELPPVCTAPACREARDEATIAELVARGVIDP